MVTVDRSIVERLRGALTDMTTATVIPGLAAGVWTIDLAHSEVSFSVRHLMVSKVRGTFTKFDAEITIAENVLDSSVRATVDMNSIDTREPNRDAHLRSADFFEIDRYPEMTFVSTSIRPHGDDYILAGDLTIKGVTKPVEFALEFSGVGADPWGGTRAGFSATAEISRSEFGVDLHMPLDGGGVVVGDKVHIHLEIEASS
jgi:polyisoprenoid-binding protein YceI